MEKSTETIVSYLPGSTFPIVSHGLPFEEACAKHLTSTLGCSKAFVVASGSLSRQTDALTRLENALGPMVVGTRQGMQPHTLLTEVLELAAQVKACRADCLIAVGGGTLIDAAKIVVFVRGITTMDALISETQEGIQFKGSLPSWEPNRESNLLKIICIPTTLSGGEFNLPIAAGVDPTTFHKYLVYDRTAPGPSLIIWDPVLTTSTPLRTWIGTGIRALDHCVESYAGGSRANVEAQDCAVRAIRLLLPALLHTIDSPHNLEARLSAQEGSMLAIKSSFFYHGPAGASHGIGHQLGALGVSHGETSAIIMPAVAKFNKPAVQAQQKTLLNEAFWSEPIIAKVLLNRGLKEDTADLSQVLDRIIRALGLPRSLAEVGIGREKFLQVAERSMNDWCCQQNPMPLTSPAQVVEILEFVEVGAQGDSA
ncbi:Fe-containing alcohol dehydrogenase [Aspergillus sclerotioniger CBS 115572]|uniref:Fe-containing alcohol dehydrogenase n=1 Tax=Aspergillus sclerotioniger CBS 115572 TaxID=1450535 RepID=A0A317X8T8_9EURO|nr:Fe-containing alcohol dehydrogenase [Aspergillus sclerotioniger CBS 115572]PWY95014.1 Fe-containing alcohol dehydrogenase [Aspergillus sclerotioniger CBS 115572]